ncbi:MAG: bifunctional phosphoribosylaminoimidazolecarboxamide formyltransferase/inosine monophosphate cyclohydrolase [Candidatus Diapherotrites archaeon]|uniref:Bifunctional phosphoribosylaminoimidazolecarboxamide formyltransferase/inosine monophosphate cyclohydrolase n=1 Tax=Candidatus Iainarchaeum sp. TaxID=3101447 RepID=A0A2D6LNW4_9ARCH|nr:bifunctional phosphoribosylaminoimidazolecarboxamide formyltransferase/inosine monophosphate cyclohydrolase [Candidatus Diapherotrites archaeon]|tara:strand:- start:4021 stop:5556 length:1536 start_codon:yes stop_codon:yes gene_type:complete
MKIKSALISVSDKTGLVEFAKELASNGVKIISSGGTFKKLEEAGVKAVTVDSVTGFPEMLDGRVKTLHPKLHGGILAKRTPEHLKQLKEQGIETIDLVVVNLYPFKETISKENVKIEEAIENIDIGGPTIIRAAAKNYDSVGVVVDPAQYQKVLADLKKNNFELSDLMKKELSIEAFEHTAFYDATISNWMNKRLKGEKFPQKLTLGFEKISSLRYGENPHQEACVYGSPLKSNSGIIGTEQLNGKELSFNNYNDTNAAIELSKEFDETCVVIVKHANPCGVAVGKELSETFKRALECDPTSAFGGVIVLNKECDIGTAKQITAFFNEVVVAPGYSPDALEELKSKKNLRVLKLENNGKSTQTFDFKHIKGGLLVQDEDQIGCEKWENKSGIKVEKKVTDDLLLGWKIVKHVKSNAIVLVKNNATIGIGVGQTSRVKAAEQAIKQAGKKTKDCSLASDAFFPFKDSIELAAKAEVKAIVEPGGSIKDEEVIEEAKKQKISLYFTGERHFKH